MKGVVAEGVKEIWLSSEDTGAYGAPLDPLLLKFGSGLWYFHCLCCNFMS